MSNISICSLDYTGSKPEVFFRYKGLDMSAELDAGVISPVVVMGTAQGYEEEFSFTAYTQLQMELNSFVSGKDSVVPQLQKKTFKVIHIKQQIIRSNIRKSEEDLEPPVIVRIHEQLKRGDGYRKTPSRIEYGTQVDIEGPSRVVYRPQDPLSCGARLWIETESVVSLDGQRGIV